MSVKNLFPVEKWDFRSRDLISGLPETDRGILLTNRTEQVYQKGEIIFRQGAYPVGIFYVVEGKAKKYKQDRYAGSHIIYVADAGELLGYHAVIAGGRYMDTAAALEESTIAFIPREDFFNTLAQSELFSHRLLKSMSHEFAVLSDSLAMMANASVRQRVAIRLIVLREKYKKNDQDTVAVAINMSRNDLAELVGTARENVIRILSEFKESGILETKGRMIIIHNVHKLIDIAGY